MKKRNESDYMNAVKKPCPSLTASGVLAGVQTFTNTEEEYSTALLTDPYFPHRSLKQRMYKDGC